MQLTYKAAQNFGKGNKSRQNATGVSKQYWLKNCQRNLVLVSQERLVFCIPWILFLPALLWLLVCINLYHQPVLWWLQNALNDRYASPSRMIVGWNAPNIILRSRTNNDAFDFLFSGRSVDELKACLNLARNGLGRLQRGRHRDASFDFNHPSSMHFSAATLQIHSFVENL